MQETMTLLSSMIVFILYVLVLTGTFGMIYVFIRKYLWFHEDNGCFFISHICTLNLINIIIICYNLAVTYSPFVTTSDVDVDAEGIPPILVWSIGVHFYLVQHFTFIVLAISRIVDLTFKQPHQAEVWGRFVVLCATAISLLFPLCFVCAFVLDRPEIRYVNGEYQWSNKVLYKGFIDMHSMVVLSSSAVFMVGIVLAIIKYIISSRKLPEVERNNTFIIHTMDTVLGGSEGIEPSVRVRFASSSLHHALLVLGYGLVLLYQYFVNKHNIPTRTIESALSGVFSTGYWIVVLPIYWALPTFLRRINSFKTLRSQSGSIPSVTAMYTVRGISAPATPRISNGITRRSNSIEE